MVTCGEGRFTSGYDSVDVGAGSVLFVPAHEPHRFHEIRTDLAALVFFGPAYRSRDRGTEQTDPSTPSRGEPSIELDMRSAEPS